MDNIIGQDGLWAVHHEEWCVSGRAIGRGPQPPEYGVELLDPVASDADGINFFTFEVFGEGVFLTDSSAGSEEPAGT